VGERGCDEEHEDECGEHSERPIEVQRGCEVGGGVHGREGVEETMTKLQMEGISGQSNVALDVARMLLMPPDALHKYDVPTWVLNVLHCSPICHVSISDDVACSKPRSQQKSCAN
jgi:hypothetical protein